MPPDRDPNLENELKDLGPRIEYPPTPDLARSVRSSLESEGGNAGSPARTGPQLWWIAAAALVVIVVPLSALAVNFVGGGLSGGASSMADGAGGGEGAPASPGDQAAGGPEARDEPVTSMQGAQAGSAAGAVSVASGEAATGYPAQQSGSKAGSAGGFIPGERITLREARARFEAPILFPRALEPGRPDEVYERGYGPGLVLLYRAGSRLPDIRAAGVGKTDVGLLLTQTRGDVGRAYLASGTVRGEDLETVSINGGRGYWVAPGERRLEVARDLGPSTGVLLWEREGKALRIEAGVPKEEAVRIAESVR